MALVSLLLSAVTTFFYGVVLFAVALALFIFTPTVVHQYLGARSRKDAIGRLVRILSLGAVTNEKVVVVVRIVLAVFIVLGALAMAHAIGLKTWIFDN